MIFMMTMMPAVLRLKPLKVSDPNFHGSLKLEQPMGTNSIRIVWLPAGDSSSGVALVKFRVLINVNSSDQPPLLRRTRLLGREGRSRQETSRGAGRRRRSRPDKFNATPHLTFG